MGDRDGVARPNLDRAVNHGPVVESPPSVVYGAYASRIDPELRRERIGAFVCGVLSLFFAGMLLGPLAIYRATRVLRRGADGLAIAAIVLGAFGIVFSALFWAFLGVWQFLAPSGP